MLEIFILFCFKDVHSKHIRTLFLPMNLSCLRTKNIKLSNGDEVAGVPRLLQTERNEGKTGRAPRAAMRAWRGRKAQTHKESIPGVCVGWAVSGVETGYELRGRRVPSATALVLFRAASRWAQPWAGLPSPGRVWR